MYKGCNMGSITDMGLATIWFCFSSTGRVLPVTCRAAGITMGKFSDNEQRRAHFMCTGALAWMCVGCGRCDRW